MDEDVEGAQAGDSSFKQIIEEANCKMISDLEEQVTSLIASMGLKGKTRQSVLDGSNRFTARFPPKVLFPLENNQFNGKFTWKDVINSLSSVLRSEGLTVEIIEPEDCGNSPLNKWCKEHESPMKSAYPTWCQTQYDLHIDGWGKSHISSPGGCANLIEVCSICSTINGECKNNAIIVTIEQS